MLEKGSLMVLSPTKRGDRATEIELFRSIRVSLHPMQT